MDFILEWLASWILKYLADKAVAEVKSAAADLERDREREVTNAENVKRYEEASSRQERIAAATRLLSRSTP